MTGISFDMVKIRLQKSIFVHNPGYVQPEKDEVIALGLSLRNAGEFVQNDTMCNLLQSFKTHPGPNIPFSLEVEFAAIFALSAPAPKAEQDAFLKKVFPQMVFPNTREYVAEITRRAGYPPLLISMGLFRDPQNPDSTASIVARAKWTH
jgi:preprotein translocase subunit SecB